MKQLIFRLNQQFFRNNKYKKKDQLDESEFQKWGTSNNDPIDVEEFEEHRQKRPANDDIRHNSE
jgi:hypothetical protein